MSVNNQKNKINSNKSFGYVFFFVFLIIALWPLYKGNEIRIWAISISLLFLVLGIINSRVLTPLNRLWYKFGLFLGKIVSPIVIGIIFFLVVTPIGFLMKNIFLRNLLNLKKNNKTNTYWQIRNEEDYNMRDQF